MREKVSVERRLKSRVQGYEAVGGSTYLYNRLWKLGRRAAMAPCAIWVPPNLAGTSTYTHTYSINTASFIMNPYISNPNHIPKADPYADVPLYGRYFPRPDDFRVDIQHVNSSSEESLQYWATVVGLCTESNLIFPADEGRDVFAVGSVIVKSSHRHQDATIDYSGADANEVQAIAIAKSALKGVRVPNIYFSGKVHCSYRLLADNSHLRSFRVMVAPCWSRRDFPAYV